MSYKICLSAIIIILAFIGAGRASAEVIINSVKINGSEALTAAAGETIIASVDASVTGISAWKSTAYRFGNDQWNCVNTPDHMANSAATETFSIVAPSKQGTGDINFAVYENNNCDANLGIFDASASLLNVALKVFSSTLSKIWNFFTAAISTSTVYVREFACDTDSDCGISGLTGSQFCQNGGVYQNSISWICNNPSTSESFCASSTTALLQTACSGNQICSDGACGTAPAPAVSPMAATGGHLFYPTVITPSITPEPSVAPAVIKIPITSNIKPSLAGYLPAGIADLSQKIPQLRDIISNLEIKTSSDAANLNNYNIFLPGLKEITGSYFPNLTSEQRNKIPGDVVFVLLGNGDIDAATKLDFSSNANGLQTVNLLSNTPVRLVLKPSSPAVDVDGYVLFKNFSVLKFNYNDNDNDGIYVADINSPAIAGQYKIATSIDYIGNKTSQKNINLTTLVDPEGYIYENINGKELRIGGAVVSLYKLNDKNQYELWTAKEYGQENPQTTDSTGKYSYLVPEGTYYLTVKAQDYYSYQSDAISVQEGKEMHSNIALKKQTKFFLSFDWTAVAIIIIFCLVIYNFYKDWQREKNGIPDKNK